MNTPGDTIKEQLEYSGISYSEFVVSMEMSEEQVDKLLCGGINITSEIALKLERIFGVPARFWNNLEDIYRKRLAKHECI